jgi:stage V sporulation protein SpoVS
VAQVTQPKAAQAALAELLAAEVAAEVRQLTAVHLALAVTALAVKSGSLSSRTDNSWPQ